MTNPLSADHSVLRPALVGQPRPGRVDEPAPRRRGRRDLRDRQGLRRRRRRPRVMGRGPRVSGGGWGSPEPARATRPRSTARRGRTTSTTRRARSSCSPGASGSTRRRTAPNAASRSSIRAGRPGSRPARDGRLVLAGVVGELHPVGRRGRGTCAAPGRRRGARPGGPGRRPALERDRGRRRRATRRASATSPSSSRRASPAADVAAAIRRHGGSSLADVRLFDIYRGSPLAADEKSLAYRLTFQCAGPDARGSRGRRGDRGDHGRTIEPEVGGRIRT